MCCQVFWASASFGSSPYSSAIATITKIAKPMIWRRESRARGISSRSPADAAGAPSRSMTRSRTSTALSSTLGRVKARERPRADEHAVQHRLGQLARERVLLARMEAAEQRQRALGKLG